MPPQINQSSALLSTQESNDSSTSLRSVVSTTTTTEDDTRNSSSSSNNVIVSNSDDGSPSKQHPKQRNNKTEQHENIKPVTSAPPPLHTAALWLCLLVLFSSLLPTWEQIDQVAVVETFTKRVFLPTSAAATPYLTLRQLAAVRLTFAALIWSNALHGVFWASGTILHLTYLTNKSKLQAKPIHMKGLKTVTPFTSWCWMCLGLSFALSGTIAWRAAAAANAPYQESVWLLRLALVAWEIAAPFTLLVSCIVKYVLWPNTLRQKGTTVNYKTYRALLQHNANVLLAFTEVALLGGLPVYWCHVSLPALFGLAYVLFTWLMANHWVSTTTTKSQSTTGTPSSTTSPQFIYFFLDTTLPGWFPSLALLGLLGVLLSSFAVFCVAQVVLQTAGDGSLYTHLVFVMTGCACTMRLRD